MGFGERRAGLNEESLGVDSNFVDTARVSGKEEGMP